MKRHLLTIALSAATIMTASPFLCATADSAPTEKVIHSFSGPPLGELPNAGLIFDSTGHLYGTTTRGGTGGACSSGCGTAFRLVRGAGGTWTETVLHSFDLSDGAYPEYPLVFDLLGNLYSTTEVGGGLGEAFGLLKTSSGFQLDVLHKFQGGRDGQQPRAPLAVDAHGNLFGTTVGGGSGGSGGGGIVFELARQQNGSWKESIIHRFTSTSDGANPQAGLLIDGAGNLYGTTVYGGNPACTQGCGTVFELSPAPRGAWKEKLLHLFTGQDGAHPVAGLNEDGSGNLFGSAGQGAGGGCFAGCGSIIELSPLTGGGWKTTVLHVFQTTDGGGPSGAMAFDPAGNLYGSTVIGGNVNACPQQDGCGVVFKLAPGSHGTWTYSVLHKFNNGADGILPNGIVRGGGGNLFGTTIGGGAFSLGTVFEVTP